MASNNYPHPWKDLTLNNGLNMPAVGLNTYGLKNPEVLHDMVDAALASGYRLFDTASVYRNESYLGQSLSQLLPKYGLKREDIFITSKLGNNEMGPPETVNKAFQRSLAHLDVEYLDLYLIHYPGASQLKHIDEKNKMRTQQSWAALIGLYENGQVNAIGVSNFINSHIEDLGSEKLGVTPAVSQIEFHPLFHDYNMVDYCQNRDIVVQAYNSFGSTDNEDILLKNPTVQAIARDEGVTPSQVLLVWALQKDIAVIPKTSSVENVKNNINLDFRLSKEQMKLLDKLDQQKKTWKPRPNA